MAGAGFVSNATNEECNGYALDYVSIHADDIGEISSVLGISAGAIAGAMAEESHDYSSNDVWKKFNDILDSYVISGIDAPSADDYGSHIRPLDAGPEAIRFSRCTT